MEIRGARVTRRNLPVGDCALVEDERLVAVVERKTRDQRFFGGVAAALPQPLAGLVRKPLARYDAEPADAGTDTRIRVAELRELPDGFGFAAS